MNLIVPNLKEDTIARVNENNTVILMKADDSDIFFKIHGLAAQVWKNVISDGEDISTFIEKTCKVYDVKNSKVESDITAFFELLRSKDLVS